MDEQLINPMGKHIENKPKPIGKGTEEIEDSSTLDVSALEKMILSNWNAFRWNLEMGKEIKIIVEENKVPKVCLDKGQMQALKLH